MSMSDTQARKRVRIVARTGWIALLVLTLAACIFDKSDYQGGGHLDRGATAGTASSDQTAKPDDTSDDTEDNDAGSGNALPGAPTSTSTPVQDAAAE